jgi:hypothetical protein
MSYSITPESAEGETPQTDPTKLEQLMRAKQAGQSLTLAIFGGLLASVVAAIIWAAITYATSYQIGFMAIGVGFLVGYAVNYFGKGMTVTFGVVGAAFALFGCLLGNLLASLAMLSQVEDSSVGLVLGALLGSPEIIVEIMKETFSPIDLLFYAIAIFQGFKLSYGGLSEEELASIQKQPSSQ